MVTIVDFGAFLERRLKWTVAERFNIIFPVIIFSSDLLDSLHLTLGSLRGLQTLGVLDAGALDWALVQVAEVSLTADRTQRIVPLLSFQKSLKSV